MSYPASDKPEIIRSVEASHLSVRETLAVLCNARTTYGRCSVRWSAVGVDALGDTAPHPEAVWSRLPDETRANIIEVALEHEDPTPRELATKDTDRKQYFVSDTSAYRTLKADRLITAPALIVMTAAHRFQDMSTRSNAFWQTDITDLKVLEWGWIFLSVILDDDRRWHRQPDRNGPLALLVVMRTGLILRSAMGPRARRICVPE